MYAYYARLSTHSSSFFITSQGISFFLLSPPHTFSGILNFTQTFKNWAARQGNGHLPFFNTSTHLPCWVLTSYMKVWPCVHGSFFVMLGEYQLLDIRLQQFFSMLIANFDFDSGDYKILPGLNFIKWFFLSCLFRSQKNLNYKIFNN